MNLTRSLLIAAISLSANFSDAEECATHFLDLEKTEALRNLKTSLPSKTRKGFVNETKGSYFYITESDRGFIIIFYTTGLFDLYGIRREGVLKFCDNDGKITVVGLDRIQVVRLEENKLIFDEGKPRQIYTEGPMPETLAKINKVEN